MTTKERLISNPDTYVGSCRSCGYDLVVSEQDHNTGPTNEILLECEMQETQECVTGEWFNVGLLV